MSKLGEATDESSRFKKQHNQLEKENASLQLSVKSLQQEQADLQKRYTVEVKEVKEQMAIADDFSAKSAAEHAAKQEAIEKYEQAEHCSSMLELDLKNSQDEVTALKVDLKTAITVEILQKESWKRLESDRKIQDKFVEELNRYKVMIEMDIAEMLVRHKSLMTERVARCAQVEEMLMICHHRLKEAYFHNQRLEESYQDACLMIESLEQHMETHDEDMKALKKSMKEEKKKKVEAMNKLAQFMVKMKKLLDYEKEDDMETAWRAPQHVLIPPFSHLESWGTFPCQT